MLTSPSYNLKKETSSGIKNMSDLTFVIPEKFSYTVVEVPREWEGRPDLVSISHYGDDIYTELICRVNGISNPFELNAGMRLICPSPDSISSFFQADNTTYDDISSENDTTSTSTSVKQKTDTDRKPSDVTVGDSRYKVDTNRKIIIY